LEESRWGLLQLKGTVHCYILFVKLHADDHFHSVVIPSCPYRSSLFTE